jgi:hypothetical protein
LIPTLTPKGVALLVETVEGSNFEKIVLRARRRLATLKSAQVTL